ncbi:hypothetical protein PG301_32550 [Parageobacillus sp. G301]|nr:hypothetical protein PG301_32550 [Parageobacillus sp. G301]
MDRSKKIESTCGETKRGETSTSSFFFFAKDRQLRNEVNPMETKEAKQVMELIILYEQWGM